MKMLPGSFRSLLGTYFYILWVSFQLVRILQIMVDIWFFMDPHYFNALRIRVKALCWINWIWADKKIFTFFSFLKLMYTKSKHLRPSYGTRLPASRGNLYSLRKFFKAFSLFQFLFIIFHKLCKRLGRPNLEFWMLSRITWSKSLRVPCRGYR